MNKASFKNLHSFSLFFLFLPFSSFKEEKNKESSKKVLKVKYENKIWLFLGVASVERHEGERSTACDRAGAHRYDDHAVVVGGGAVAEVEQRQRRAVAAALGRRRHGGSAPLFHRLEGSGPLGCGAPVVRRFVVGRHWLARWVALRAGGRE